MGLLIIHTSATGAARAAEAPPQRLLAVPIRFYTEARPA
jgi:hypothetical protein